ncbi:calcium-activated chloride channel regulator 3A-1-like [Amblyomma americanum]
MEMNSLLLTVTLLSLLNVGTLLDIDAVDGGYIDVVVSISKNVPYNESVIKDIKSLFQSSAEFLHQATNGLVYFKHVIIDVPHTWPSGGRFRHVSSRGYEKSDVRVGPPVPPYGDRPFTKQVRACGDPGEFIHITPDFLGEVRATSPRRYKNPAYTFVHEWAHFRYGVFDEYGCPGDDQFPLTYCSINGQVKLNSCSARMRFTATLPNGANCSIKKNCQFTDDCKIDVFQPSDTLVESSIMFMPYLANNEGRLGFLKEATSRYIRDIPEGSLRLAIVTFSGTANIAYNLTTVLNTTKEGPEGAIVVLMSDGNENQLPYVKHVLESVVNASVEVTTLALGPTADNSLEDLALATGGRSYAFADLRGGVALDMCQAFVQSTTAQIDSGLRPVLAKIYADVTKGSKVVLDAEVFAEVIGPIPPHKSTVRLHDDGHDPDVHRNDGTYSGYFTGFTGPGRYSVMCHVSSQNTTRLSYPACGSGSSFATMELSPSDGSGPLPTAEYLFSDFALADNSAEATNAASLAGEAVGPLQRSATAGAFRVTTNLIEKDVPPGDIRDLSVTEVRRGANDTFLAQLTWTWPGAHLTNGQASMYN